MADLQGKGRFSRRDVSFGDCNYILDAEAATSSGMGTVTLLSTAILPQFPEKKTGYLLELADGTRLGCELLDDLDKKFKHRTPTRRYSVRAWPKAAD